jgi:DNA-3-methyladenine glycosylase
VPLPSAFFDRDPRDVAPDLLGCVLASAGGGVLVGGIIVETEAYLGSHDPGSHAATKDITERNAAMYGPPGSVYVYFTYGIHHMLNLVCDSEGKAGAVLVRALRPTIDIDAMRIRRGGRRLRQLCDGPGKLAQALGVDLTDNTSMLGAAKLQVYAGGRREYGGIDTSGRIGLSSGGELPYRYYFGSSEFVSRGRPGAVPRR